MIYKSVQLTVRLKSGEVIHSNEIVSGETQAYGLLHKYIQKGITVADRSSGEYTRYAPHFINSITLSKVGK